MMISRLVTPVTLREGECVTAPPHKNRQKIAIFTHGNTSNTDNTAKTYTRRAFVWWAKLFVIC